MSKKIPLFLAILLLSGCSTLDTPIVTPSGRRGYTIQCGRAILKGTLSSYASCLRRAGELCPGGYDMLSREQGGDRGRDMSENTIVIECR